MPMLDACIPEGALLPGAEDKLLARLTGLLLQHEGVDPANQAARALARFSCTAHGLRRRLGSGRAPLPIRVPGPRRPVRRQSAPGRHGGDDTSRGGCRMRQSPGLIESRVGVHRRDPRRHLGGFGRVVRLPDIAELVPGPEMRVPAKEWLTARRRKRPPSRSRWLVQTYRADPAPGDVADLLGRSAARPTGCRGPRRPRPAPACAWGRDCRCSRLATTDPCVPRRAAGPPVCRWRG